MQNSKLDQIGTMGCGLMIASGVLAVAVGGGLMSVGVFERITSHVGAIVLGVIVGTFAGGSALAVVAAVVDAMVRRDDKRRGRRT